jgi:magnesium transporter
MQLFGNYFSFHKNPGTAPGVEYEEISRLPTASERARITCCDYSPDRVSMREIGDVDEFLAQHRPEWSKVRWINVDGVSDMRVVSALATKYELHPLAIEDLLATTQRPKVEPFGGEGHDMQARIFVITRMRHIDKDRLYTEQISIFLGHKTVLILVRCKFRVRSWISPNTTNGRLAFCLRSLYLR